MEYKKVDLAELSTKIDPVVALEKDRWGLLSTEFEGKVYAMTVAWGALGNIWGRYTATIYVRPTRFTKPFIDKSGKFTLSFFDGYLKELGYLGRISAREVPDKIEKSGLHIARIEGFPSYEEANLLIACTTLYAQDLKPECFTDRALERRHYPLNDWHKMYIGNIDGAFEISNK